MDERASATLAAIVKDERPYLIEWVAYHRLIGFDRLLLYSNDCSDGTDELLDAMQDAGLVTHRRWPSRTGISSQVSAYEDAVARADTRWIMFLDADELLCLKGDDDVHAFLGRFPPDISAIAINWRLFGSGGQLWPSRHPVMQRFVHAATPGSHNERHCKTIAIAADIARAAVHRVFLRHGRYVDGAGADIEIERMGFTPRVEHGLAQVNHYVVKSLAEFGDKQRRGNAHVPPEAPNRFTGRNGNFFANHDTNQTIDRTIQRWLPAVKEEMARIERVLGGAHGR